MTRRDDLEALAYTLLEFLRTDGLPWDKDYPIMATIAFTRRQMYNGKRAWSGERFANGYDATFGEFLEEVRAMKFEAIPDYQGWVNKFSKLVKSPVELPGGQLMFLSERTLAYCYLSSFEKGRRKCTSSSTISRTSCPGWAAGVRSHPTKGLYRRILSLSRTYLRMARSHVDRHSLANDVPTVCRA